MAEVSEQNYKRTSERAVNRRAFLELLQSHDLQLIKALGQNFLYDKALLDELARLAGIEAGDCVLEVGSGAGSLTESLADQAFPGQVLSCEIDTRFEALLKQRFADFKNVNFYFGDALDCDFSELLAAENYRQGIALRVAANLPYYITTELITKFILELPAALSMSFMIQAEATQRVLAQTGQSKAYSPLAALIQWYGNARIVKRIPRQAFIPEPNVDSVLIRLDKIEAEPDSLRARLQPEIKSFHQFLEQAFSQRRKTLLNNLKVLGSDKVLRLESKLLDLRYAKTVRAEALSWQSFAELYFALQ